MAFWSDQRIHDEIQKSPSLAPGCRSEVVGDVHGKIKAGSLDLTIGDIFIPGVSDGGLGSHKYPRKSISLGQGQTAIIRTTESLQLAANAGGIAFPPASLSLTGLLTTNPGHIDPGYKGKLHLTVINMGREAISLKTGMRIVRVLFYSMNEAARHPYISSPYSPITADLLESLSHDFMNVENRAKSVAQGAVLKSTICAALGAPLLAAALSAGVTYIVSKVSDDGTQEKLTAVETRMSNLETRLGTLGANVNLDSIDKRLKSLEKKKTNEK